MLLKDLVCLGDLDRGINDGLIAVKNSPYDDSVLYSYTDKAMVTSGAWDNPAVRICRGLIVRDGLVVARPWPKFFNHDQAEAGGLIRMDEEVEVTDKLDGSLGIIYRDGMGILRVATRGSFESDQAKHATRALHSNATPRIGWWDQRVTPLVEIVYPENRIVCDYEGMDDLILLGGVDHDDGQCYGPLEVEDIIQWEGRVAETFEAPTLRDALALPPREGAEGIVIRAIDHTAGDRMVKVKQRDYVELHRIVTGLSGKTVWQAIYDGKWLKALLADLPDELHDWTTRTWQDFVLEATCIEHEAERRYAQALGGVKARFDRAEFAGEAKKHGPWARYLFAMYDGKPIHQMALKAVKPKGDTRAWGAALQREEAA